MIPIYVIYAGANVSIDSDELYFLKYLTDATGGKLMMYRNAETMQKLVQEMKAFRNGLYELNYQTRKNDLKKGVFRNVSVRVNYNNLTGQDIRGGYPIP